MNFKKITTYSSCDIAALAVAGFALPRHVSIDRTAVVDTAPEALVELAGSNSGHQAFNTYKDLGPNL